MLHLQRLTYTLISACLLVYLLVVLKGILVPLVFAVVFTLMLIPISSFFERLLKSRIAGILVTFLTVLIPLAFIFYLISFQLMNLSQDLPDITKKIQSGLDLFFNWTDRNFGISRDESENWLEENLSKFLQAPGQVISEGITISTGFILNFFLTFIYVFFLLWYRTAAKQFLLLQFKSEDRAFGSRLIYNIQEVVQNYLFGLLKVIGILAVLNSLGLWLIGINYPIFWGCLAACLVIIPYIGTTTGGFLPFIYALATTGTFWQPAAVELYYFTIQQIEGNFITPYVVGSTVKINPLVAIISLIVGGVLWGLAGLILALPFVAILRLLFSHINHLKPVALLLRNDVHKQAHTFLEKWDADKFRLTSFFKDKKRKK